jgi:Saxitoxin biosynthesis operon protein SxtJ
MDQCKDTGMAMVLILLLLTLATRRNYLIPFAIGLLALTMIRPQLFRPAAVVWFGLSHVLGIITSRIVLSIIFFLVVTPVGVVRRLLGTDALNLKSFKKGHGSVMEKRNHTLCANDLVKPY